MGEELSDLKKGLTQICLGSKSSIADALQLCKEIGYQGLEALLTESGELTMQSGPAEYEALRRMSEEAGVELTSLCGAGSFTDDDPAVTARSLAQARKMLEAAQALGIDTILITGGRVNETSPTMSRTTACSALSMTCGSTPSGIE